MLTPYNTDSLAYLQKKISEYFDMRGLKKPDTKDSCMWVASEVGEMIDAVMRLEQGWVRNNPDRESKVEDELGDVLMMLLITAETLDINIMDALLRKMNRKTGGELLAGQRPLDASNYQPLRVKN